MDFCKFCDNLLNLTEIDTELKHVCSTCKRISSLPENFNPCIIQQNYGGDEKIFYESFVNKYTKYDPTLPHVSSIPCPNSSCKSTKTGKNDVINIRYNEDHMKYIYLCVNCNQSWIQPDYEKKILLSKIEDLELT